MAQTQLSSKLGSNNSIFDVKENAKIQFSKFDYSKKNFSTLDIGTIVPVDWFDVYPGDVVKYNVRYLLESFPLIVPPMNNYRVRTHWYYIKKSALWSGWQTFITKGRNGSINLTIPTKKFGNSRNYYGATFFDADSEEDDYISPFGPSSLSSYLGLKPMVYNSADTFTSNYLPEVGYNGVVSNDGFLYHINNGILSALPFFAYQKIYRHAYLNPNLMQDNKVWFPENLDSHWRIDYDKSNFDGESFIPDGDVSAVSNKVGGFVPSVGDTVVNISCLRYAPFEMDYFTSAKPWLVRGSENTTDMEFSDFFADYDTEGLFSEVTRTGDPGTPLLISLDTSTPGPIFANGLLSKLHYLNGGSIIGTLDYAPLWNRLFNHFHLKNVTAKSSLSANTLRQMLAVSVWQERNALTNGNYNEFIDVHFNRNPKSDDYEPYYLGGTSDLVQFGRVIQTSASVPGGNPLGSEAGQASASGGANVFDFKVNDYGIIMGVMIISPEVIYNDGIGHEWTDLTSDSIFTPEFANLGYQPILNKEIKFTNNPEIDDSLFGYQTRYAYLKQRKNSVSGLFALDSAQDRLFNAYVQKRHFVGTPSLSLQFVTMSPNNIDRSFLAYPSQPAFKLQFAGDVDLIRALPYQSEPNTFGF